LEEASEETPLAFQDDAADEGAGQVVPDPPPLAYCQRDPFYFPTKGQFLVEVIRKFRNSPAARQAWEPHLTRAEAVIAKELQIVHQCLGEQAAGPVSNETIGALWDCDEMVHRLVIGYLDRLASQRGQVVRRLPPRMQGEPLFAHRVQLAPQPEDAELYYLSEWDFGRWSYTPGLLSDLKRWKPVSPEGIPLAGECRFLAIWKSENQVRSSGYVYRNITKDDVVPLIPKESWPPRALP
jgi:hypothetical protein